MLIFFTCLPEVKIWITMYFGTCLSGFRRRRRWRSLWCGIYLSEIWRCTGSHEAENVGSKIDSDSILVFILLSVFISVETSSRDLSTMSDLEFLAFMTIPVLHLLFHLQQKIKYLYKKTISNATHSVCQAKFSEYFIQVPMAILPKTFVDLTLVACYLHDLLHDEFLENSLQSVYQFSEETTSNNMRSLTRKQDGVWNMRTNEKVF